MKKFFFLRGRVALRIGLKLLNLNKNDELLIPSLICDTVIKELREVGVKPKYYNINKKFIPIWADVKKKISKKTKGLFMINFFGKPQNRLRFRNFCDKNKLYLIEDNCHGFDGFHKKNQSSDILFSSPYKIIDKIDNGGVLIVNKKLIKKNEALKKMNKYRVTNYVKLKKKLKNFNYLKIFYRLMVKRPNYESISIKNNEIIKDCYLDDKTINIINNFSFNKERKLRLSRFLKWKNKIKEFGLYPYFSYSNKNKYILWHLVVKVTDLRIRKKIFDWGWKNNVDIISWPSFPNNFNTKSTVFKFSRNFILFPLNKNYNDQIRKFKY